MFTLRALRPWLVLALTALTSCATEHGRHGTLLLIGGGLDNDNAPVYGRFLELARRDGPPRIVIATAATGPQDEEATDKTEALRTWCPTAQVVVVRRETPTPDTVAAIDAATAMFFTGGDQKRITDRYRPGDQDTPEWLAMQRLLQRGGVIAGASAGDAMMGESMFTSGGSAHALGIASAPDAGDEQAPPGPQLAPGMHFLPWLLTDSHFFERDRVGRLVAGLEACGTRLGIGVGEDACVEVDLGSGDLIGVSVSESLLVDAAHLRRDGLARRQLLGRVIRQGDRVSLPARLATRGEPPAPATGDTPEQREPIAEPGQNRQLASWRLFRKASGAERTGPLRLSLDGWAIRAWPSGRGDGDVAFELIVERDAP